MAAPVKILILIYEFTMFVDCVIIYPPKKNSHGQVSILDYTIDVFFFWSSGARLFVYVSAVNIGVRKVGPSAICSTYLLLFCSSHA